MLDWFLSKIGIIIFTFTIVGVLLYFTTIQNTIYKTSTTLQDTRNIARIADSLPANHSIEYIFSTWKKVVITNDDGKIKIK